MGNKKRKRLVKSIKQIHKTICSFKYQYFRPIKPDEELTDEELAEFDEFRNDTLFKLVDQWKKMELELAVMDGLA